MWKEIEEFMAAGDYEKFIKYIEALSAKGEVIEMELAPETIVISGYRWFKHLASGEIWCLYPPEGAFRGGWRHAQADPRFMSASR